MDVILKVLEGAKAGTKIAVKKDEFLIGRSQKCHLCAGSSSVSRKHCVIRRKDTTVSIEDLGSRNGTLINGKKTSGEVELSSGDEIGIGTLKMLLTVSHGINNLKRPKVESVADAVDRAVVDSGSSVGEADITSWLLDTSSSEKPSASEVMNETQTIQMDDTNAVLLKQQAEEAKQAEAAKEAAKETAAKDAEASASAISNKKEKKKKKPEPGKLPPIPHESATKDSREAAMQALRNWNRRS